jgi:hypothetical protein
MQANPSIKEISIVLLNRLKIPYKIYDIKKIIENIQKGYPNLTLLKIEDIYDRRYNVRLNFDESCIWIIFRQGLQAKL